MSVDEILAALGTAGAASAIGGLSTLDSSTCEKLLLSPQPRSGGRAGYEDWVWLLHEAAWCWPDQYLSTVEAQRQLLVDHPVVVGLSRIPGEVAERLLVAAVTGSGRSSEAGWARGTALQALVARASPSVPDLLPVALSDQDWNPQFEAIRAAIEWGDPRLLPRLAEIAEDPSVGLGAQEFARDASEAISQRYGLDFPQARLVSVQRTSADAMVLKVHVGPSYSVDRGHLLMELTTGPVLAPCDGIVSSVPAVTGEPAPATLVRIRLEGQRFADPMPD